MSRLLFAGNSLDIARAVYLPPSQGNDRGSLEHPAANPGGGRVVAIRPARVLGLEIPMWLLTTADEVLE